MSIEPLDDSAVITMGTVHTMLFKFLLWIGPIVAGATVLTLWDMRETVTHHEWVIGLQDRRLHILETKAGLAAADLRPVGSTNTNSISINTAKEAPPSGRDYLTTEEVAAREGVSSHTVTNWIQAGLIDPPPARRDGRGSFAIDSHYAVLSEKSRKLRNSSESSPGGEP